MEAKFSPRVKDVIQYSREEALRLGHDYIGTEHLLLGLIRDGDGVAIKLLKELTVDFKKPVLLVNGDSHMFLVDKPMFSNAKDKKCIDNFTRLQVPGESNMHAVKVTVNPNSKSIFQVEQLMVEGN